MARFELTISHGEKILVDHAADGMLAILAELEGNRFVLFNEVKGGSAASGREVIVASQQITLVRLLEDQRSTQGSGFKSKR